MKKLIIAAIALVSFSAVSFAQSVPAVKKTEPSKLQAVKNITAEKNDARVIALNKVPKPGTIAVTKTPVIKTETKAIPVTTTTNLAAKPASVVKPVVITKTNAAPLKKDGTPDKRFKTAQAAGAGPLKKDGTADKRYKANKKN
ncbi:MAG: hypothetical protein ACKVOW_17690 [Chitinophagaceae bacterium]